MIFDILHYASITPVYSYVMVMYYPCHYLML